MNFEKAGNLRASTDWANLLHKHPPKTLFFTILFMSTLLLIFLNFYLETDDITFNHRILASSIIILSLIPTLIWCLTTNVPLTIFPFFCLIHSLHYAFPIYMLPKISVHFTRERFDNSQWDEVLVLILFGMICLLVGYYIPLLSSNFKNKFPRVKIIWNDERRLEKFFIYCGILGILAVLFVHVEGMLTIPLSFRMIFNLMTDLTVFGIIFLFVLFLFRKNTTLGFFCLFLFFIFRVTFGLANHSVGETLRLVLPLTVAYACIRRRIPLLILGSSLLFFLFLRPFKGAHIEEVMTGNIIVDLINFLEGAVDMFVSGQQSAFESLRFSWYRLSYSGLFIHVMEWFPSSIPFWGGESYYPVFTKMIPRFLYPEKPMDEIVKDFGHMINLLNYHDFKTSVSLPSMVEFYLNFGKQGVYFGMFFFGIFIRFWDTLMVHREMGLGNIVIYLFLGMKFLNIEQHISASVGSFFPYVYLSLFICLLVKLISRVDAVSQKS